MQYFKICIRCLLCTRYIRLQKCCMWPDFCPLGPDNLIKDISHIYANSNNAWLSVRCIMNIKIILKRGTIVTAKFPGVVAFVLSSKCLVRFSQLEMSKPCEQRGQAGMGRMWNGCGSTSCGMCRQLGHMVEHFKLLVLGV